MTTNMKIIRSLVFISALIVLVAFLFGKVFSREERVAGLIYAQGGIKIEVDFKTDKWPFFETNFLPGDKVSKTVIVRNISSQLQKVGFRMTNVKGYLLSIPLFIKITDKKTGQIYYGGSGGLPLLLGYIWPTEIKLFDLPKNEEKKLEVEISFLAPAGNEFQGTETKFDFSLGFIGRALPLFRFFSFFR